MLAIWEDDDDIGVFCLHCKLNGGTLVVKGLKMLSFLVEVMIANTLEIRHAYKHKR